MKTKSKILGITIFFLIQILGWGTYWMSGGNFNRNHDLGIAFFITMLASSIISIIVAKAYDDSVSK